jgi:Uma2 family endonuclease
MSTVTTKTRPELEVEDGVRYPSEDGQPMAETPIHVDAILLLYQALEDFFRDRTDVFIAANIFWYWEKGNPDARLAPDVMIVPAVPREKERRSFFSWREGGAIPAAVFEIASRGTWRENLSKKYSDYERLGVNEYYVFDPEGEYVLPALTSFCLVNGTYRRVIADADGSVKSQLGFRVRPEGRMLRVIDDNTGQAVLTHEELADAARKQAAIAEARIQEAQNRADAARAEADLALSEAEELRQQAVALEAELRALRQQLGQAGGPTAP